MLEIKYRGLNKEGMIVQAGHADWRGRARMREVGLSASSSMGLLSGLSG